MADAMTQDFKVKDLPSRSGDARKSAWPRLKCPV